MSPEAISFRILGPLEVWAADVRLRLDGPRQERVLAALLLADAGHPVSIARLVDVVWDAEPPATAKRQVQDLLSRLRRALLAAGAPSDVLRTTRHGYVLRPDAATIDARRFEALTARAATESGQAATDTLREALALWRGPALDGIGSPALEAAATAWNDRHLAAWEQWAATELELGRPGGAASHLAGLVEQHPFRERLVQLLMEALYRDGRRADALQAYHRLRQRLNEDLGIYPGADIRRLSAEIIRADDAAAHADAGGSTVKPAQLPAVDAHFTGRGRYVAALDALLPNGDGVVASHIGLISGTAGVGKTSLALHWAHRVRPHFPDGQLYVNLRGYASDTPLRPIDALSQLLHAMGVPADQVPLDEIQAANLYRSMLADRRMLVVLDNARTSEQVRPLLPGGRSCATLVTSRDQLPGLVARHGARRVMLDVLSHAEAVTLIGLLTGRDRVAAEPAAARELVRLCAALPLAVRIVSANLAGRPHHTIATQVGELRSGNRLAGLEIEGEEEVAVRAAFDLSYSALPDDDRRLFRLLGLVPGPDFTPDAAAALVDAPIEPVGRTLRRLARANLVREHAAGRYAFHDLLRLYASQRAHHEEGSTGCRAATGRLLDHYVRTADSAARMSTTLIRLTPATTTRKTPVPLPDRLAALRLLDDERANLVAAATHAAANDLPSIAWQLTDALRGYFHLRAYAADALTVAQAGLAAARAHGEVRAQVIGELSMAGVYLHLSRTDETIAHLRQAQELAERCGWRDAQTGALANLGGLLAANTGDLAMAEHYLRRAESISGGRGSLAVRQSLALVYCRGGTFSTALRYATDAAATASAEGRDDVIPNTLILLGQACHALGRLTDAAEHLTTAVSMLQDLQNSGLEAEALVSLAMVRTDLGDHERAAGMAERAINLSGEIRRRVFLSEAWAALGTAQLRLDRTGRAVECLREAVEVAATIGYRYAETEALVGLALAEVAAGRPERAGRTAEAALHNSRSFGYRAVEGLAGTALAEVSLSEGRAEESVERSRQALEIHRETGHRLGQARTLVVLGRALHAVGRADQAQRHWVEALAIFTECGSYDVAGVTALLEAHEGCDTPETAPSRAL